MFINYGLISYFIPITLCTVLGARPFWLSLWYVYSRLEKSDRMTRIMLLLVAIVLALANFVLYLMLDFMASSTELTTCNMLDVLISACNPSGLPIIASFAVAIAIAVLIYPIDKAKPKEVTT